MKINEFIKYEECAWNWTLILVLSNWFWSNGTRDYVPPAMSQTDVRQRTENSITVEYR